MLIDSNPATRAPLKPADGGPIRKTQPPGEGMSRWNSD
jgi:hypothetical protein